MNKNYKVKFGDIWKIGDHRLLCGDSTESSIMEVFLNNLNPKLCLTDPPYGINFNSKSLSGKLRRIKVKYDHIATWGDAFRNCKSPVLYTWFSFKHYEVVARSLQDSGYSVKQLLVWIKNHFTLQHHFYQLKHEQCLLSILEDHPVKGLWTGDRKQTSVWNVPSVSPRNRIHPTEKPVGVYTIPILNHTKPGDLVIDIFAGSGVLFEAAEVTNRIGYGVELCPATCELILNRMADFGCEVTLERNIFDLA